MDGPPSGLKSEFSVKCFGIMQPLLQDIAAKKEKIDQCDDTIQSKEKILIDVQSKYDQLQIKLAVSEAVVREKERQLLDQHDLYTSHKNNSLVKDELLKAYRIQVSSNEGTIKAKADQIELLLTQAKDREEELDKCKSKVDQLEALDNSNKLQQEADEAQIQKLLADAKETAKQLENQTISLRSKTEQLQELQAEKQWNAIKFDELKTNLTKKDQELETIQQETQKLSDQLGAYKLKVETINTQLEAKDTILNDKQLKIDQLQLDLKSTNSNFEELKTNLSNKEQQLETLQVESQKISDQLSTYKLQAETINTQLDVKNTTLHNRQVQINQLQRDLDLSNTHLSECKRNIDMLQSTNCFLFGNSSDIHEIRVPGISPFEVLCDSHLAGQGWTVIQRRIDGSENFYRNWTDYRNGFGSLHGEFFIGLEKLYRMTTAASYELYIHLESFDNATFYARYAEFSIGSEKESYFLKLLGPYTGTAGDGLYYGRNRKFSTFDVDNDRDDGNCAELKHGAWWYDRCGHSNLNGQYMTEPSKHGKSIFWFGAHAFSFKSVQMMLRPKSAQFTQVISN
ncbi:hypothetical protein ACLKA6_000223 [Drosophila palustris]